MRKVLFFNVPTFRLAGTQVLQWGKENALGSHNALGSYDAKRQRALIGYWCLIPAPRLYCIDSQADRDTLHEYEKCRRCNVEIC